MKDLLAAKFVCAPCLVLLSVWWPWATKRNEEVRNDGPTADTEEIHFVFSFARSLSGDLESAHFTGERTCHVLLLRQPRSWLPGLNPSDRVPAREPGVRDAGRFWKKFRRTLLGGGVKEDPVFQVVYTPTVCAIAAEHHRHTRGRSFVRFGLNCRPRRYRPHQTARRRNPSATSRCVAEKCAKPLATETARCAFLARKRPRRSVRPAWTAATYT